MKDMALKNLSEKQTFRRKIFLDLSGAMLEDFGKSSDLG
jgi:hypothetical protein